MVCPEGAEHPANFQAVIVILVRVMMKLTAVYWYLPLNICTEIILSYASVQLVVVAVALLLLGIRCRKRIAKACCRHMIAEGQNGLETPFPLCMHLCEWKNSSKITE